MNKDDNVGGNLDDGDDNGDDENNLFQLKQNFIEKIKMFWKFRIKYAQKRLLSADLKQIYSNVSQNIQDLRKDSMDNKLVKFLLDQQTTNQSSSNKGGFHYLFINFNW